MARFSHKDAYIEVATVDISGRSNSVTLDIDVDISEITCSTEDWDTFVENTAAWSVSVDGFTEQTAADVEDTLFSMIGAGPQALDYRPQGQATGYKFTGNVILKTFSVGGAVKGACGFSASFQGTDTLSRTAI